MFFLLFLFALFFKNTLKSLCLSYALCHMLCGEMKGRSSPIHHWSVWLGVIGGVHLHVTLYSTSLQLNEMSNRVQRSRPFKLQIFSNIFYNIKNSHRPRSKFNHCELLFSLSITLRNTQKYRKMLITQNCPHIFYFWNIFRNRQRLTSRWRPQNNKNINNRRNPI